MRLKVVLKSYQSRMNVVSNTTFISFRYIKKMILLYWRMSKDILFLKINTNGPHELPVDYLPVTYRVPFRKKKSVIYL